MTVRRGQGRAIECPGDVRTGHGGHASDQAILDGAEARGGHVQGRHQIVVGRAVVSTIFDRHGPCQGGGGGGIKHTIGRHRNGVGTRCQIGVDGGVIQVGSGKGGAVAEVPCVLNVHGGCESAQGLDVDGEAGDRFHQARGKRADRRWHQLSAIDDAQAQHNGVDGNHLEVKVHRLGRGEGVGFQDPIVHQVRNVERIAGSCAGRQVGRNDVQVEGVRIERTFPISGEDQVDVGVLICLERHHFWMVDPGLDVVVRVGGIGPVVDGFPCAFGGHFHGLHVGEHHVAVDRIDGSSEEVGNVAFLGDGIRVHPLVVLDVSTDNPASIWVNLDVEGFDVFRGRNGSRDIHELRVDQVSIGRIERTEGHARSREMVHGQEETVIHLHDVRRDGVVRDDGLDEFTVALPPNWGAVVVKQGGHGSLVDIAIEVEWIRRPHHGNAGPDVHCLSEVVAIASIGRAVEFPTREEYWGSRVLVSEPEVQTSMVSAGGRDVSGPSRAGEVQTAFVDVELEAQQSGVDGVLGVIGLQGILVKQGTVHAAHNEEDPPVTEGARQRQSAMSHEGDFLAVGSRNHFHVRKAEQEVGPQLGLPHQRSVVLLTGEDGRSLWGAAGCA